MKNPLEPFQSGGSVDLYRTIRPFRRLLGSDTLKQKDAEKLMGIRRRDRFSGKELIATYQNYLQTGDSELLDALFLHNREDVTNMIPLFSLTGIASFFAGDFTVSSADLDPVSGDFRIMLRSGSSAPLPIHARNDFCTLDWIENDADLTVWPFRGTLKHFFSDYRNYYYLPEEDQAIHKSVGAFVDPAHRKPAKAANCYNKKSGTFLPQPQERIRPVFRSDYRSKYEYFFYEPDPARKETISGSIPVSTYALDLLETLIL